MKRFSFFIFALLFAAGLSDAQEIIKLWPGGIVDAKGTAADEVVVQRGKAVSDRSIRNVHEPTLEIYLPEKANGTAVVVCPGGGYGSLAYDKEGVAVAKWLNTVGVAGFVLKYRLKEYGHPYPLFDLQRAIRTVRHRADQWNIDPARVGVCGFSAGGHLVTTAATHYDPGNKNAIDQINRQSSRPDFVIGIYPVVSQKPGVGHSGSFRNLLGNDPDKELLMSLSNELRVTRDTPPAFLVHADDDRGVPSQNSIDYYLALITAGVPAEMHIYSKGGHGFGLWEQSGFTASDWPGRCQAWMKEMNFIK